MRRLAYHRRSVNVYVIVDVPTRTLMVQSLVPRDGREHVGVVTRALPAQLALVGAKVARDEVNRPV